MKDVLGMRVRKLFFSKHARSSAIMASVVLHAVILVVAFSLVAVTVIEKREQTFEAVTVKRPRMKPMKLTVPVDVKKKRIPKPRLKKTITAKPRNREFHLEVPEITGIKGGTGYLDDGGGGSLGFGMEIPDLFGSNKSYGNELVGTLYDLKLDKARKQVKMNDKLFFQALSRFCTSWNKNRIDQYFKAPRKRFSTVFYIPTIAADAAPKAFGVQDIVKPKYWIIHYKGAIAAPEDGKYRFWGYGDDVLVVRLKKRVVLQANWKNRKAAKWNSQDKMNRKHKIFGRTHETLFIGDWVSLKKGEEVPIELLVGECGGGMFACALMIEQQGVQYGKGHGGRPVLPLFKTKAIPEELISQMHINPDEATTEGPSFGASRKLRPGIGVDISL